MIIAKVYCNTCHKHFLNEFLCCTRNKKLEFKKRAKCVFIKWICRAVIATKNKLIITVLQTFVQDIRLHSIIVGPSVNSSSNYYIFLNTFYVCRGKVDFQQHNVRPTYIFYSRYKFLHQSLYISDIDLSDNLHVLNYGIMLFMEGILFSKWSRIFSFSECKLKEWCERVDNCLIWK